MSQQAVETVIGKAVVENEYRYTLLNDPDAALAGYELTGSESAALKSMDVEALENFAGTLDQRISKSIPIGVMAEDGLWVNPSANAGQAGSAAAARSAMGHLPEGA